MFLLFLGHDLVLCINKHNFNDSFLFQITLQDETLKNKVRVIMVNFTKNVIPKDKNFVNNVYLDIDKIKGM